MGALDGYRREGAYPGTQRHLPKMRVVCRGQTSNEVIAIKNPGPSTIKIKVQVKAANNTNNGLAELDVNAGAFNFGSIPLGGTPVSESHKVHIVQGVEVDVHIGAVPPFGIDALGAFDRVYVAANAGSTSQTLGEGRIPPGAAVFLSFSTVTDVAEYTVLVDITSEGVI